MQSKKQLGNTLPIRSRIEELPDSDVDTEQQPAQGRDMFPMWLGVAELNNTSDYFETTTSTAQERTQAECMPLLMLEDTQGFALNSHGLPHLNRAAHIRFLHKVLEPMPFQAQAMDAARPWFFYWTLQGLTSLREDVSCYRERLLQTLKPLQNPSGGFAGGHGQASHCATSYGCVLSLAIVDGLEMINRKAMWQWLGQVKQSDGGFKVAVMAEEDIRGAYCAMTIITLLNLPLDLPPDAPARADGLTSFLDGLGEWISRCQTFEGGIGGAPTNEAHGAYAFCALACLSLIDAPHRSIPRYLELPALLRWIVDMQTSPEGGFAGRTNKLVDACYSHWVGGCWSLLDAAQNIDSASSLWNRAGLIRYLLTCCQKPGKSGGMRDKPSARPDAYHTCYSLAGLSAAMHYYCHQSSEAESASTTSFHWTVKEPPREDMNVWLVEEEDMVQPIHPVFVIPFAAVEKAHKLFKGSSI